MKRQAEPQQQEATRLKRKTTNVLSVPIISDDKNEPSYVPKVLNPSTSIEIPSVTPPFLSGDEDNADDDHDETSSSFSFSRPTTPLISAPVNIASIKIQERKDVKYTQRTTTQPQNDFRCGLVFEAGSSHYDRHNRFHQERPVRVTSIMDALKKSDCGALLRCFVLNESSRSASNFLDDEDYLRVHLPGYMKRLDRILNCSCCDEERLDREAEQFKSIYFTKDSLVEAKKAAASLCSLVEKIVRKELDNGFAVIRPPGHHAEPGLAGGYCIINNVAVAASFAKRLGVKKILIVDWDVHHGNGTQSIFLKDPNVLYFSAHRWHGGNFFPFLSNGGPTNVGVGDGEGFNMNVGWSSKGMGDDEYVAVWEKLLLPVAKEFQPELILVSAGFDAADGDLGECHITPEGYGRLTRCLMTLDAPIVCALEGGYVRSVLGKCVCEVVAALLDRNSVKRSKQEDEQDRQSRGNVDVLELINQSAAKNIQATVAAHENYWHCLR